MELLFCIVLAFVSGMTLSRVSIGSIINNGHNGKNPFFQHINVLQIEIYI